ncbi:class I SAM-dependent methyltransferase [Albimonas pacifica]|uniref:Ubiquinone/menaquinone biosynthesis C-methylase UbiE n=1 Tax=Albimonas pacifica TaxID=1114924 RepID=A0A1I3HPY9_9RHOB|nr:class I SAM-dependent methyltransferase [Albimonas pacifica]SFI37732.1 Ubiquinone/menaquinone biosynthesis C-methylase UbiE [Albimonas pacifica]
MHAADEWRGAQGRRWAKGAEAQDRFLAPFGEAAMTAQGPVAALRVLDLGCGAGATTVQLAQAGARVTGLDVSPDLVAMTRARIAAAGLSGEAAEAVEADAALAPPPGPYDRLFSRFGCMFFDAPEPAWRTLRRSMAPGGWLTAVAWRTLEENEWASLGFAAAREAFEEAGEPFAPAAPPGAPGPFGWGDPQVVRPWLEGAGWREVAFAPLDLSTPAAAPDDPDPVESATTRALESGPVAGRLRDAPEALREAAAARLRARFAERAAPGRLELACGAWIVTAQA